MCKMDFLGALVGERVRCPFHGACFNVRTGDIEDYPGLDSLPTYKVKQFLNTTFIQSWVFNLQVKHSAFAVLKYSLFIWSHQKQIRFICYMKKIQHINTHRNYYYDYTLKQTF